jgi:hypothetical protein
MTTHWSGNKAQRRSSLQRCCSSHSATGNAQAADDKARSQQERTNKTLSQKLDQRAGVICPPEIDPAIKAATPNAGKTPVIPPPAARVGIRPFSQSDACALFRNQRALRERKWLFSSTSGRAAGVCNFFGWAIVKVCLAFSETGAHAKLRVGCRQGRSSGRPGQDSRAVGYCSQGVVELSG